MPNQYDTRERSVNVLIRVSRTERAKLKRYAKAAGMTVSDFVRIRTGIDDQPASDAADKPRK